MSSTLRRGDERFMADVRAAAVAERRPGAGLSLLLLVCILAVGLYWAERAVLDEVTVGEARVVPSSREQVIQSLEGGILAELKVREGDVVAAGDVLLRIDDTRFGATYREGQSRQQALRAATARLEAEAAGIEPRFPEDLPEELVASERRLYETRSRALEEALSSLQRSLGLAGRELAMTAPLVSEGVVSEVEVLRLRREVNDLRGQIRDRRNAFRAEAQGELAAKQGELEALAELNRAREDQVRRTVVRAPMRGTVKDIQVSTVGGVIQPGEAIMEIVPLEDQLLVEARIRPADVAFLRPGLEAVVKLSAYDYSIYGGLQGTLEHISADTISDENNPRETFYRVLVRTESAHLEGNDGPLPIIPGMVGTVEILTGSKSVLDYLLKPVLKVRDNALRER
jgi:adhesin transport system membrane fusion protein